MTSRAPGRLDPIEARARAAVELHLAAAGPTLVALSGGADSLALTVAAAHFTRHGHEVRAVVVDHGLQAGSADVADRAARQAEALGVPATVVTVEVGDGNGPEDAARTARYDALHAQHPDAPILLAHTLDDQAETVLLGLGRGSGPRSLQGMRPVTGRLHRPFLTLRRSDTEALCRLHGLQWWDDPHNADPRFRRVRVRRELLPLLEDVLDGGVAEALARTADLVRTDADALDAAALRALAGPTVTADGVADLASFADHDPSLRWRLWRLLALRAGATPGELTHAHVLALDTLLTPGRGGRVIELPGGVTATRRGNRVEVGPGSVAR